MTTALAEVIDATEQEEMEQNSRATESFLVAANQFDIASQDDYLSADKLRADLMEHKKKIEAAINPHIERAHKTHKELCNEKNEQVKPLEEARKILGQKMAKYQSEQERKRMEEQRRIESEEKKKRDEAALKEAAELAEQGREEEANAVLNKAVSAPVVTTPVVSAALPKTKTRFRIKYAVEVIDASHVPDHYKVVDVKLIEQTVKARSGDIKIPGVKITEEKVPY